MEKQFKEWLRKNYRAIYLDIDYFEQWPLSMRWGIYLEFFDSLGIHISCHRRSVEIFDWRKTQKPPIVLEYFNTRKETEEAAVKKAFEILNQ